MEQRLQDGLAQSIVLLEDTWEADDVVEECGRRGVSCRELTVAELEVYDARAFVCESVFMCNTDLVQTKLRSLSPGLFAEVVPDTYPHELHELLRRDIARRELGSVQDSELPLFVKPVSNDKAFDGRVVADVEQLSDLRAEVCDLLHGRLGDASEAEVAALQVYAAAPVHFQAEFRLFVGGGRMYCGAKNESYLIRRDADVEAKDLAPPEDFMRKVVEACPSDVFWVVDVGFMVQPTGSAVWAVVEVNPPFSLDDHGLPIKPYMDYCIDACAWIKSKAFRHTAHE